MTNSARPLDEGDQHLQPVEAVGAAAVGRRVGETEGEPRHAKREDVDEHVRGVGEQRQRAGNDAADHLGDHEGQGEQRRQPDPAAVHAVAMVMRMVVSVGHGVS